VWGWLWADGAWTARGGGDGGTVLVPARGFELWFYSVGWGTIRGQGRTQAQNFDERQSFFFCKKGHVTGSLRWIDIRRLSSVVYTVARERGLHWIHCLSY
jgi:hypothetical protein